MDYTWYIDSKINPVNAESNIRVFLDFGISGLYYFIPSLAVSGSFVFRDELNPFNDRTKDHRRYNAYLAASVKYSF